MIADVVIKLWGAMGAGDPLDFSYLKYFKY